MTLGVINKGSFLKGSVVEILRGQYGVDIASLSQILNIAHFLKTGEGVTHGFSEFTL